MLQISERQNENTTIFELDGDVIMGGGSAKLRDAIKASIEGGKTDILLNFSKVRYLDSSGTGEILSTYEKLSELGGSLKLSNLNAKVEEVLTLSSILPILDTYDDEASALAE